jgi:cytochrome P450 family 710 subfamily A protein
VSLGWQVTENNLFFPFPEKFNPDRFSSQSAEHVKNAKNYLAFGYGPHRCIGKEYAINHLMLYTALMAMTVQWKRNYTSQSEEIVFGTCSYSSPSSVDVANCFLLFPC